MNFDIVKLAKLIKHTMTDSKRFGRGVISLLSIASMLFACTPEEKNISGTVEAIHVSAISAVLYGKANLGPTASADLQVGFQYSKSAGLLPSNSTTIEATDADANYNYTASITGLEPATRYYFRSFVRQNGQDTYGETKEFTTKDVSSLIETKVASDIEATEATLCAKLDLTDVQYKGLAYGFFWGVSESALNTDYKCTEINNNAISASLTGLSHKTQYWYKAYVMLDSQIFYGEVKTFTTDVVPVESVSLNKTEYTFNTIDNTLMLTATVLPADATDKSIEWTSDDENVATVDASGKITAKGNGTANITATAKDQGKTASCVITVAQWVTSISLDKTSITLNEGQEQSLIPTVNPSNAADKSLTWISSNLSVATVDAEGKVTAVSIGTATIKATSNDGSEVFASCSVVVVKRPCPAGAVDLGLSVYWATCNIGASKPEDYGDYYAWGETETKSDYSWSTYKFGSSSSGPFSKYNSRSSYGIVDNKTVLDPEDDVAHVKLGGQWRMPTYAEWTELRNKCTWTWTSDYNGTGVSGRIVTAPNGNIIFLPATGGRVDSELYHAGSYGDYWSSSLISDNPYVAFSIVFYSGEVYWGSELRFIGQSVRPVTK